MANKTLLISGAARRIGAAIAEHFHQQQFNIVLTYQHSEIEAQALEARLNHLRPNSAKAVFFDLTQTDKLNELASIAIAAFGQIDVLINNASAFYVTPVASANIEQWQNLLNINSQCAYFLSQALVNELQSRQGCIINLLDIYAEKPLKNHSIYNISKAAASMLTRSLALDLAPNIRVNGIAPGAILWPENSTLEQQQTLLEKIPLQKKGEPLDIAKTAFFLSQSPYITGQIIAVDGGRSLNI